MRLNSETFDVDVGESKREESEALYDFVVSGSAGLT